MVRKLASIQRVLEIAPIVGDDVTEALGVTKYEPVIPLGGAELRGGFPSALPKTDEMRVRSVPEVLDELRGLAFVATLQCDGTSATCVVDPADDTFHACARNWSTVEGNNPQLTPVRRAIRPRTRHRTD
jgi:hypothetical protein